MRRGSAVSGAGDRVRRSGASNVASTRTVRMPTPSRSVGVIHGLDVIRFVAAVFVLLFHFAFLAWNEPAGAVGLRAAIGAPPAYLELLSFTWWGWIGVEIFFVISGFVIAMSAEGKSATDFVRGRVLRLAPGLWVFSTVALVVTWQYAEIPWSEAFILYAKSVTLFPKGPWLDGVVWTLTVEAVFYVLIGLLLWSGHFAKLETITLLWGIVTGVFWFACLLAATEALSPKVTVVLDAVRQMYLCRLLLLTTGPFFVLGIVLFLMYRSGPSTVRLGLVGSSLISGEIAIYFSASTNVAVTNMGSDPRLPGLVWLGAVAAIILAMIRARGMRSQSRPDSQLQRILRVLGLASYPLYLVHYISGAWVFGLLLGAGIHRYSALALACLACIACSIGFAVFLEPGLRRSLAKALDRLQGRVSRLRVATPG